MLFGSLNTNIMPKIIYHDEIFVKFNTILYIKNTSKKLAKDACPMVQQQKMAKKLKTMEHFNYWIGV